MSGHAGDTRTQNDYALASEYTVPWGGEDRPQELISSWMLVTLLPASVKEETRGGL